MLSKGDFESARVLFDEALRIEPSGRDAFVADRCADNRQLAVELRKLLDAHESSSPFFDQTGAGLMTGIQAVAQWVHTVPAQELRPDQTFGRYRILHRLGAGGMGEVYLAEDPNLGRRVAIKLLPPGLEADETRKRRLEREARLTSQLNHSRIMTVYDIGQAEGRMFIAAEFVDGVTLRQKLADGPLPLIEALRIAGQVADALEAAHAARVVHRDIKPENVMLRRDGGVKVLDFGAATAAPAGTPGESTSLDASAHPFSLAASQAFGTIRYASPEQVQGMELDARTDVWSLGVLLYELVSGDSPFAAPSSDETLRKILKDDPPPLSLPANRTELRRILGRALAKPRDQRYPSMREFREEIDRARQRLTRKPRKAIAACLVAAALAASPFLWRWFAPPTAHPRSIAVLPFKPLVADSRDEPFELGIADTLITSLSSVRQIAVRPLSAVRGYAGLTQDPLSAGAELRVEFVLEGSIHRVGDRLRVTARLLKVHDGSALWAGQFDENYADVFAVENSISEKIVGALALQLNSEERKQVAKRYTANPEAYRRYLMGRYFWSMFRAAPLQTSAEYFRSALELDPHYALAYAGLSETYAVMAVHGPLPPKEALPKAREAAAKAVQGDDSLAEAHAALASVKIFYERDWPGAEREVRRAMELNPSLEDAHHLLSFYLEATGRVDEAVAEMKLAKELNPVWPVTEVELVNALLFARRYDEAIERTRAVLKPQPDRSMARWQLGEAYLFKGMYGEADAEFRKMLSLSRSRLALTYDAYFEGRMGSRPEALRLIEEAKGEESHPAQGPYFIAAAYTGLGDNDQAIAWLEKAFGDGEPFLWRIKVDPVFDSLRSDPRFADLLRRLNLRQ